MTMLGGVRASHCSRKGQNEQVAGSTRRTDLLQADILVAICVEDLEEVQRRVTGVLDIVSKRGRDESNVAGLGAGGQPIGPRAHPCKGTIPTWKLKVRAFELEPKRVTRAVPPL